MKPCKAYQPQIALLSVQVLSERESAAVRNHLRECTACRAYAKQLEGVVGLYTQDAQREVAVKSVAPTFEAERAPWHKWLLAWPRPALVAAAALAICAVVLLNQPERDVSQPAQNTVAIPPQVLPAVPTVGDSRHLTASNLEDLVAAQSAQRPTGTEFVYSVRTRNERF